MAGLDLCQGGRTILKDQLAGIQKRGLKLYPVAVGQKIRISHQSNGDRQPLTYPRRKNNIFRLLIISMLSFRRIYCLIKYSGIMSWKNMIADVLDLFICCIALIQVYMNGRWDMLHDSITFPILKSSKAVTCD